MQYFGEPKRPCARPEYDVDALAREHGARHRGRYCRTPANDRRSWLFPPNDYGRALLEPVRARLRNAVVGFRAALRSFYGRGLGVRSSDGRRPRPQKMERG